MTRMSRRPLARALLLAPLMAILSCVATPAPAEDMSLLHIEVTNDVGQASAWIYIDGEPKGAVGPGCALSLPIHPGRHKIDYVWHDGSISRSFTVLQNEVIRIVVQRGPEIILAPAKGPQSPVCA